MLEYYITMHAKVHMTCGKTIADYCTARAIIASPCFWHFRGNWLKRIPKLLGQSCQCRCLLHTSQEYNKIRNFYCHQILFFTGDCTSDVSSRCSVSVSQQFLENYETNQPVTTLCTSHFSFTPTHHPTPTHTHTHIQRRQLASVPWCFIFNILNLMKHVQTLRGFVVNSTEWDLRKTFLLILSILKEEKAVCA